MVRQEERPWQGQTTVLLDLRAAAHETARPDDTPRRADPRADQQLRVGGQRGRQHRRATRFGPGAARAGRPTRRRPTAALRRRARASPRPRRGARAAAPTSARSPGAAGGGTRSTLIAVLGRLDPRACARCRRARPRSLVARLCPAARRRHLDPAALGAGARRARRRPSWPPRPRCCAAPAGGWPSSRAGHRHGRGLAGCCWPPAPRGRRGAAMSRRRCTYRRLRRARRPLAPDRPRPRPPPRRAARPLGRPARATALALLACALGVDAAQGACSPTTAGSSTSG